MPFCILPWVAHPSALITFSQLPMWVGAGAGVRLFSCNTFGHAKTTIDADRKQKRKAAVQKILRTLARARTKFISHPRLLLSVRVLNAKLQTWLCSGMGRAGAVWIAACLLLMSGLCLVWAGCDAAGVRQLLSRERSSAAWQAGVGVSPLHFTGHSHG